MTTTLRKMIEAADAVPDVAVTFKLKGGIVFRALSSALSGRIARVWLKEANYVGTKTPAAEGPWWTDASLYEEGFVMQVVDYDGEGRERCAIVSWAGIGDAVARMAIEEPRHFGLLMSQNGDEGTRSVFLQYLVFGKIVYA